MSIYTKKGDKGKTNLFSGGQVSKGDLIIDAAGAIDEVNSFLGIIISETEDQQLIKILKDIQKDILNIGSSIGGSRLRFSKSKTTKLEKIIDNLEKDLPKLKNFILPGGCRIAAKLHFARALCRRAERIVVALSEKQKIKPAILTYLNRLSDVLFVLARSQNFNAGIKDETWISENK